MQRFFINVLCGSPEKPLGFASAGKIKKQPSEKEGCFG